MNTRVRAQRRVSWQPEQPRPKLPNYYSVRFYQRTAHFSRWRPYRVAFEGVPLMTFKFGFVPSRDRVVFSEYAEALTNPIKHISQLHKRETQLAVLLEDNSEVGNICGTQEPPSSAGSQSYGCLSSTSPTSPKTESPGKRATWCQEATPPSTPPRSTRWTMPPISSSCLHQVEAKNGWARDARHR